MSTTECAIDLLGRFDRVKTDDMTVDAQRRGLVRVPKILRRCGWIAARTKYEGRGGMPEVVQSRGRDLGLSRAAAEGVGEAIGASGCPSSSVKTCPDSIHASVANLRRWSCPSRSRFRASSAG
jgi:hypothetical protein